MATRLANAKVPLVVWNRSIEKAAPFQAKGVTVAKTPESAIRQCEVAIVMLATGDVVQQTLFSDDGKQLSDPKQHPLHGRTVIQMSTISPRESRALHSRVVACGGRYIECPVLGSTPLARAGTLQLMLAGDTTVIESVRPVLSILGRPRVIGPNIGQAATMKLALNQIIASQISALSLSLGMVARSGLDIDMFMEILRSGPAMSAYFDFKLPVMREGKYDDAVFTTAMLLKDLRLVVDESKTLGLNPASASGITELAATATALGWGGSDAAALCAAVLGQRRNAETAASSKSSASGPTPAAGHAPSSAADRHESGSKISH